MRKILTVIVGGVILVSSSQSKGDDSIQTVGLDRRFSIGTGIYGGNNLNLSQSMTEIHFGYHLPIQENSEIFLSYSGLYQFGQPLPFSLGSLTAGWGQFFIPSSSYVPFVSGELGYGSTSRGEINANGVLADNNITGAMVGLSAGMRIRSISWINFEIAARYERNLASYSNGSPGVFGLRLSVLF